VQHLVHDDADDDGREERGECEEFGQAISELAKTPRESKWDCDRKAECDPDGYGKKIDPPE
jgi:hypothetical protein